MNVNVNVVTNLRARNKSKASFAPCQHVRKFWCVGMTCVSYGASTRVVQAMNCICVACARRGREGIESEKGGGEHLDGGFFLKLFS